MAVQVTTLDTLTKRAHFDPEIARAIGDAIAMELENSRQTLATKQDITALRQEFLELRHSTELKLAELRQTLKRDIDELRVELRDAIANCKVEMIRWMVGAMLAQTSVIVAVVHYMIQHP